MTSKELFNHLMNYSQEVYSSVEIKFSNLTSEQINHKPSPQSWSCGECFEHLMKTNGLYIPTFNKLINQLDELKNDKGEEFKNSLTGKFIIKTVDPEQVKKYKSPKAFRLSVSNVRSDVIQQFLTQDRMLKSLIEKFNGKDLRKIKIASPASSLVRYNLGDCFTIIAYHNKRHINQAEKALISFTTYNKHNEN